MSTFSAQQLAHELERAQNSLRDVLTEPVLYDPSAGVRTTTGYLMTYRPMTRAELALAQRYLRRAEKQSEYHERRKAAADRRQAMLARAERAAYDEDRLRTASAAIARIAAASR